MSRKQHKSVVDQRASFFVSSLTKRQNMTVWIVALGMLVVTIGCSTSSVEEVELTVLPVETIRLKQSSEFEAERTYSGVLRAARASELGFERTGQLVSISVDEGDRVYAGQSLAKLDARNLQARLEQLEAELQSAQALLDELKAGPRVETIAAQRALVAELAASTELQDANFDRRVDLRQSNTISKEEFEQFDFEKKASAARLVAAQQQLSELENGTRPEKIAAQSGAVKRLNAAIKDVRVDLEESELVAPFAGTISQRHHDEGTILPPATKLLRLVETSRLEVWIGMPARAAATIELENSFQIQIDNQVVAAIASERLPELDPATRTRTVIFVVDDPNSVEVIPGQLARVTIVERQQSLGFWVPTTALVRSTRGLWSVYALNAGEQDGGKSMIQRRDVEVVYTRGDRSYIRGTVVDGDEIVAAGTHRIVPGQLVRSNELKPASSEQLAEILGGQGND
jgi:multidrug efflux pump subunit AcrA (membrane-fusion protein)